MLKSLTEKFHYKHKILSITIEFNQNCLRFPYCRVEEYFERNMLRSLTEKFHYKHKISSLKIEFLY